MAFEVVIRELAGPQKEPREPRKVVGRSSSTAGGKRERETDIYIQIDTLTDRLIRRLRNEEKGK